MAARHELESKLNSNLNLIQNYILRSMPMKDKLTCSCAKGSMSEVTWCCLGMCVALRCFAVLGALLLSRGAPDFIFAVLAGVSVCFVLCYHAVLGALLYGISLYCLDCAAFRAVSVCCVGIMLIACRRQFGLAAVLTCHVLSCAIMCFEVISYSDVALMLSVLRFYVLRIESSNVYGP